MPLPSSLTSISSSSQFTLIVPSCHPSSSCHPSNGRRSNEDHSRIPSLPSSSSYLSFQYASTQLADQNLNPKTSNSNFGVIHPSLAKPLLLQGNIFSPSSTSSFNSQLWYLILLFPVFGFCKVLIRHGLQIWRFPLTFQAAFRVEDDEIIELDKSGEMFTTSSDSS